MADETTPAALGGEQPQSAAPAEISASPATPTPNGEKPQDVNQILADLDVTKLTDAQLADLESGDSAKIAALLGAPEALKVKTEGEAVAKDDKPAGDANLAPAHSGPPNRISLKALPEPEALALIKAVSDLKSGKYKTLAEAVTAHLNLPAASAAPQGADTAAAGDKVKTEPEPGLAPVSQEVQALETKITELAAKRDKAKKEFDYELAEKLTEEIGDAKLDLRDAKKNAASTASVQAAFTAAEEQSRNKVLVKYAGILEDDDHEFHSFLDVEVTRAERAKDPILNTADWPEKIADRVWEKNKARWGDANSDPAEEPVNPIPAAPRTPVRLPGAPIGGGANTAALTASAALAEFEKLSAEEKTAVMARLDKSTA